MIIFAPVQFYGIFRIKYFYDKIEVIFPVAEATVHDDPIKNFNTARES